jgi:exonuclease SbcD
MGFGEANQKKCVYLVDFAENTPKITAIEIPVFQKLESIQGDKTFINNRLTALIKSDSSVWVEIFYTGDEVFPDFTAWVNEAVANTKIEIINHQNRQYLSEVLTQDDNTLSLNELDIYEVFDKLLEKNNIAAGQQEELKNLYHEIIVGLSIENQ